MLRSTDFASPSALDFARLRVGIRFAIRISIFVKVENSSPRMQCGPTCRLINGTRGQWIVPGSGDSVSYSPVSLHASRASNGELARARLSQFAILSVAVTTHNP